MSRARHTIALALAIVPALAAPALAYPKGSHKADYANMPKAASTSPAPAKAARQGGNGYSATSSARVKSDNGVSYSFSVHYGPSPAWDSNMPTDLTPPPGYDAHANDGQPGVCSISNGHLTCW